jgi:hypothetical protein
VDVAERSENSPFDEAERIRRDCERTIEAAREMLERAKQMQLRIEQLHQRLEQGQIHSEVSSSRSSD